MIFFRKRQARQSAVLAALLDGPETGMTGLDLCRAIGVGSGTLYPTLARLERAGWIDSRWQENPAHFPPDFPRRRLYTLTRHGRTRTLAALGRYDTR